MDYGISTKANLILFHITAKFSFEERRVIYEKAFSDPRFNSNMKVVIYLEGNYVPPKDILESNELAKLFLSKGLRQVAFLSTTELGDIAAELGKKLGAVYGVDIQHFKTLQEMFNWFDTIN